MPLAPISYGPPVEADQQGSSEARRAVQEHSAVFAEARQLGATVEGGAQQIAQGLLHNQALAATAAVKEKQAGILSFIDSNPYVPKSQLQGKMSPADYEKWHESLGPEYKDKEAVPMFTAAGALFDSTARQAREDAGKTIALPGWREGWASVEQRESATIRERYVNRMAADQMVADQRAQALTSIDKMMENAVSPGDFKAASAAAQGSPWLRPAERRIAAERVGVAADAFPAEQAMLARDVPAMKEQLDRLRSPDVQKFYPNMTEKQRLDLSTRLQREFGYRMARQTASSLFTGHIAPNGKVDSTAVEKAILAYDGPNQEEVVRAAQIELSERKRIFDATTSDAQQKVWTAGQDPQTGEFNYDKAMASPGIAKLARQLNEDDPGKITALHNIDQRRLRQEDIRDREAYQDAQRKLAHDSDENRKKYEAWLDDPSQSDYLKSLTPSQWDSMLLSTEDGGLVKGDREALRKGFKDFMARGGKPDERASVSVKAEIMAAANGNSAIEKKLSAKYEDDLTTSAHAFIRTNAGLDPAAMTDALRKHLRTEMFKGAIVGGGIFGSDRDARRIEWETNPAYRGKDFKLPDGSVLKAGKGQMVRLSRGGTTLDFPAENAEAAKADGWR